MGRIEPGAPIHVLACEREASRSALVERVLEACGACAVHCPSPERLRESAGDGEAAVVDVSRGGDPILAAIGALKHAGIPVIAHDAGADAWPVSERCRILLAGATHVLDCADAARFEMRLRATVCNVLAGIARRRDEQARLRKLADEHGVVGTSAAVLDAFRRVVRFSELSDLPVLITGESGTGKELFASALHALDPKRRSRPLVAVNCAAITPGIAESELFGHARGAFTGAVREHAGFFFAAEGGVLFLDEIGELDLGVQAKILRVLQERRITRVGSGHDAPVDIRVVAATNRDLASMTQQGAFRVDLFHRLTTLSVHIPPLRQRREDIAPLVEHFMAANAGWRAPTGVDADLLAALAQLDLKGNVRELRNLIAAAQAAKGDDLPLGLTDLPSDVWRELSQPGATVGAHAAKSQELAIRAAERHGWNLAQSLGECEREIMAAALERTRYNQSQAARLLGLTPRSVYTKLRKHGLPAKSLA